MRTPSGQSHKSVSGALLRNNFTSVRLLAMSVVRRTRPRMPCEIRISPQAAEDLRRRLMRLRTIRILEQTITSFSHSEHVL